MLLHRRTHLIGEKFHIAKFIWQQHTKIDLYTWILKETSSRRENSYDLWCLKTLESIFIRSLNTFSRSFSIQFARECEKKDWDETKIRVDKLKSWRVKNLKTVADKWKVEKFENYTLTLIHCRKFVEFLTDKNEVRKFWKTSNSIFKKLQTQFSKNFKFYFEKLFDQLRRIKDKTFFLISNFNLLNWLWFLSNIL